MSFSKSLKSNIPTFFQGICIGIGNIIPGVSGGTIILILGLLPRVLHAMANISLNTVKSCLLFCTLKKEHRSNFYEAMQNIDAAFLISLGTGAIAAIYSLSFVFTYILEYHRAATFSFFLGLIFISVIIPYRLMKRKSWKEITAALLAFVLVVYVSYLKDGSEKQAALELQAKISSLDMSKIENQKSASKILASLGPQSLQEPTVKNLAIFFGSSIIAICAMILPGISGSYLLLLMGVYSDVLIAIAKMNLPVLLVFSFGCCFGLVCFSRFLKYILSRYSDPTMAFFTGLLVGSLYGIWPFKEIIVVGGKKFYCHNIFPDAWTAEIIFCCFAFISGCILVVLLEWYGQKIAKNSELSL